MYKATGTAYNVTYVNDYKEFFGYDPNGNITTVNRYANAGTQMDNMVYHYNTDASGKLTNNRLNYIADAVAAGAYPNDIDNQSANNYTYDAIGDLTADVGTSVNNINWSVYGKIQSLTNSSGTISYSYDAAGQRVTKASGGITTYYVRDAQGNTLATYNNAHSAVNWMEQDLYGSSRLGMWQPTVKLGTDSSYLKWDTVGKKAYELTNHLGNVLATITDKRLGTGTGTTVNYFKPDVATEQEYYPFGGLMPSRTYTQVGSYRYGFNGKENDNDVKGTGNEQDYGMRIYDPRVGRFLSVDPLTSQYPWYTPYSFAGNGPIENLDLDGEEEFHFTLLVGKDGNAYFKATSPPIYYNEHSWFGGFVRFKTEIQGERFVVKNGSNTYFIGFASDRGRTNNYKVPLFKQLLKHPTDVKLFLDNFDTEKQSRMTGFFQDMQTSVAASLMAHQAIEEGQTQPLNNDLLKLKNGSGPTAGVLEVSPNVKSVAQFKNYNPNSAVEFVFDPKTNTFAVGIVKESVPGLSPHQNLAKTIGASPAEVVGGMFKRGANGEILTNEASGHYYRNWTPEIREQFQKFLETQTGQQVKHTPAPSF